MEKKLDKKEEEGFIVFCIFFYLKHAQSKLLTQEDLFEAIAEFKEPHSNAQITIEEANGQIKSYQKKRSNIATYIAHTDKILKGREGPVKDLIVRHKKILHEAMVHIKGQGYTSTDEISFYEFKRVVKFL